MKFSINRVQKFITVFLTLNILLLLYSVYIQQNKTFAWIVGGLSILAFVSYIVCSEKRANLSIWLSTIVLIITSFCNMIFLNVNELYRIYHLLLPIVLIFYFRKGPIYFFPFATTLFFLLGYFMNDQIEIFPENYSVMKVYLISAISWAISIVIVFIMKELYRHVLVETEKIEIIEDKKSIYLQASEIPYIFYLKAIADNITTTALDIRNTAKRNIENILKEKGRLQNVTEVAHVMQKTFFNTTESIEITRDIINKTLNAALTGDKKVGDIMEMVNKMIKFVDITKKSIYDLNAATKKVEGVVSIIDKIAGQTRLLSLNASIEGARFETRQAGFVTVSREVKELAALTHLSVQDITNTMRDINSKTRGVQEIIAREAREAMDGLEVARMGEQSIKYVVRMMESIQSEIVEISEDMEVNKDLAIKITDNFLTIKSFLEENLQHMEELDSTSSDMEVQGNHLGKIIHAHQIKEMLTKQNDKVYSMMTRFVIEFEKILENEIRRGTITEDSLFSREYNFTQQDGTERYHSKYDGFFEAVIQGMIDNYMEMSQDLKYFVVMDNEGYVPLANSIYAQKSETEEENLKSEKTEIISRPGVILLDYVSKHAIKSDMLYSLQCIQAGREPIMDMSVQIYYKDKYWGVVRTGFRYS